MQGHSGRLAQSDSLLGHPVKELVQKLCLPQVQQQMEKRVLSYCLWIRVTLARELISSYNHVQLRYFMKMLMDNGWTKTKDEVLSQHTQTGDV